jgi:predicted ATP-binding protein involved in virulence
MRLQRVQIPNFRVLKDIDITFEEHHTPQIFPLASQNGGGKSTFPTVGVHLAELL